MLKGSYKRVFAVAMILSACAMAGCDGKGASVVQARPAQTRISANVPDGEMRDEIHVDDTSGDYATVIEKRHFDVYKRYRMAFDDAPDETAHPSYSKDGEIKPAIMTYAGGANESVASTCSVASILTDD